MLPKITCNHQWLDKRVAAVRAYFERLISPIDKAVLMSGTSAPSAHTHGRQSKTAILVQLPSLV